MTYVVDLLHHEEAGGDLDKLISAIAESYEGFVFQESGTFLGESEEGEDGPERDIQIYFVDELDAWKAKVVFGNINGIASVSTYDIDEENKEVEC